MMAWWGKDGLIVQLLLSSLCLYVSSPPHHGPPSLPSLPLTLTVSLSLYLTPPLSLSLGLYLCHPPPSVSLTLSLPLPSLHSSSIIPPPPPPPPLWAYCSNGVRCNAAVCQGSLEHPGVLEPGWHSCLCPSVWQCLTHILWRVCVCVCVWTCIYCESERERGERKWIVSVNVNTLSNHVSTWNIIH